MSATDSPASGDGPAPIPTLDASAPAPDVTLEAVPEGSAPPSVPGQLTDEEVLALRRKLPPGLRPYNRLEPPTPEHIASEDVMNNCVVRSIVSGVMGAGLGALFGVFMGTMDGASLGVDGRLATGEKQSAREIAREMLRNTGSRTVSYAKGFAVMGTIFAGSECVIETARGRHDSMNTVYAGCATGAALAYSAGPKAMCIGCASFAAFSALIDRFMGF